MPINAIRETIQSALAHEERTGSFRQKLAEQLPRLRARLELPDIDPVGTLMCFVIDYVRSVPGSLNLVSAVSKRFGFHDYTVPFLELAEDYILHPPPVLPSDEGLEAMLDEAYLSHRLLEEVNDHHQRELSRPLLPVDMTEANLIVHYLVGDEFATRLEHLVQITASQLLARDYVWERVRALPGVEQASVARISSDTFGRGPLRVRLRLERS